MDYKQLIMLKAIFNRTLHDAIINRRYKTIHAIMRTEYSTDLKLHNITSLYVDFKHLRADYLVSLEQETDYQWAL